MKKSNYTLLIVLIALTIINIFSDFLVEFIANVFGDEVKNNVSKETLLMIFGTFIFFTLGLIVFQYFQEKKTDETQSNSDNIEPDVKRFHDSLKERYQKRYGDKLDERFEITLEVSEDWNRNKTQSFTERYDKDAKISEAFPRLKELFDTKDGLLIVGEPGAGKTVLLLKIALNLLEKTNLQIKEAFPVIFNLASWNKDYNDFGEWLKAMLVSGNGLSKDFAARLLHEKRLILLLDGLDELARNESEAEADKKRAACLKALNNYLDGEKTIICCRIDEFNAMHDNTAQDAPVSAKVEVLTLTEAEVLNALEQAQNDKDTKHHASAKNLCELLVKKENDSLRKILCTPFYFTIAIEVFYKHLPEEINLRQDEEKLKTYLIEKYFKRKLDKTPNPNNFNQDQAKKWLKWLAQLMESKQKVNFELADLQPTDLINKRLYALVISFLFGLFSGLLVGLLVGLVGGLVGGLLVGLVAGLIFSPIKIKTEDVVEIDLSFKTIKESLFIGLFVGLVFGLFVGLILGLIVAFSFGLFVGLIFGLFVGLIFGLQEIKKINPITNLQKPYQRLLGGFAANLMIGIFSLAILAVLIISLDYLPMLEITGDINLKGLSKLFWAVMYLPMIPFILTPIFLHSYLRLSLWYEGAMPLKYATFLDYAAGTRILEKDGGFWRFRHQNLQEYFAKLEI